MTIQLEDVPRSALVNGEGQSYAEFRARLTPRWPVVARDFLIAYLMLATSGALVVIAVREAAELRLLWIAAGALLIGFWMAYLQLFLHEAAHFNLWRGRRGNDRLANLLVGVWVGTDIGDYRQIHWDHHRLLGEPGDTERSYFSALNTRFVLESLLLVNALQFILLRRGKLAGKARSAAPSGGRGTRMLVAAALLHGGIVALAIWQRQFELAAAWVIGNLMVYPLFGALRQLLEHRDSSASRAVDYAVVPHGKTTRSFRPGLVGRFFGGAGFRLHDIHHFDPELSYTCLPAADAFLGGCPAARAARSERKSYLRVARELWQR